MGGVAPRADRKYQYAKSHARDDRRSPHAARVRNCAQGPLRNYGDLTATDGDDGVAHRNRQDGRVGTDQPTLKDPLIGERDPDARA